MYTYMYTYTEYPHLYGIHLKLHSGVYYSHPMAKSCLPPSLTCVNYNTTSTTSFSDCILEFTPSSYLSCDWNYPFDLCGGLYRVSDALNIVNHLTATTESERLSEINSSLLNPNTFEVHGNIYFNKLINNSLVANGNPRYTRGGCMTDSCVYVVTVNRVQTTYNVPIYDTTQKIQNGNDMVTGDLAALNSLITTTLTSGSSLPVLDCNKYQYVMSTSPCVHIGDMYFKSVVERPHMEPISVIQVYHLNTAYHLFIHICNCINIIVINIITFIDVCDITYM
jgi:hypothetical protein